MPAETHSHRDVSAAEVERVVRERAAELLGIEADDVEHGTLLPDDAVAMLQLVEACEEELGERTVGIDTDDATEWRTVGDVITHLSDTADTPAAEPDDAPGALDGAPAAPDDASRLGIEAAIGHHFAQPDFLTEALSHRSWVAEHPGDAHNERLEFLGDAVLGIVVTDALFRRYPDLAEGALAKARATVVNAVHLAGVAVDRGIGPYLLLGKGEDASGGRDKPSILSDAMEAIIGAVYLDGGMEAATTFVLSLVEDELGDAVTGEGSQDYKTPLQEAVAQRWSSLPHYTVTGDGPDHAKRFTALVRIGGAVAGEGTGRSKKQAEQAAARSALEWLDTQTPDGEETNGTP